MTVDELVDYVQRDGVVMSVSTDGRIILKGNKVKIEHWTETIRQNKPAVITLLKPGSDGWSRRDWREFFNVKTGIAQCSHGLLRQQAEKIAFSICIEQWHTLNLVSTKKSDCARCEKKTGLILPYLTGQSTHTWLHQDCSHEWHQSQRKKAIEALNQMGIMYSN